MHVALPAVPKINESSDDALGTVLRPLFRSCHKQWDNAVLASQSLMWLIRPVQHIDKRLLEALPEETIWRIEKKALKKVGGRDFRVDNAPIDEVGASVLEYPDRWLEP